MEPLGYDPIQEGELDLLNNEVCTFRKMTEENVDLRIARTGWGCSTRLLNSEEEHPLGVISLVHDPSVYTVNQGNLSVLRGSNAAVMYFDQFDRLPVDGSLRVTIFSLDPEQNLDDPGHPKSFVETRLTGSLIEPSEQELREHFSTIDDAIHHRKVYENNPSFADAPVEVSQCALLKLTQPLTTWQPHPSLRSTYTVRRLTEAEGRGLCTEELSEVIPIVKDKRFWMGATREPPGESRSVIIRRQDLYEQNRTVYPFG